MNNRLNRLNSLLKKVISDIILRELRNQEVHPFVTVKKVEVAKDLRNAKVFVSLFASKQEKRRTLKALQSAAGFISIQSAKKVVIRYFPRLTFHIDESLEHEIVIDTALRKIKEEQNRHPLRSCLELGI